VIDSIDNTLNLDRVVDGDKKASLKDYEANCPIVHRKTNKDVPWCGEKLEEQRTTRTSDP
jgi:hypothetical protein